jgi:AcrR family transcriptional regulator
MTKAERTRQFIVEKTAPLFNMKGYAGTSLSDMMEATGLTKGSIYGNFANKDEVALAVFDYNCSLINKGISAIRAENINAIDKLLKLTNLYRTEIKSTLARGGCPILNTAVDADDTHPALKKRVSKSIRAWKKSIESAVKQGMERNEIKSNADPAAFATEFIALIEGGIMLMKATGETAMLTNCIKRIETIINNELKV